MKKNWLIFTTGLALFSMFFGSGNLVFPISVGKESEGHFLLAFLGIFLTGVIVPFLGVFGMMLYNGDINRFFGCFGKKGTLIFSCFALALMGPFGVLARCLTVAHGALLLIIPNAPLSLTSIVLCVLIYFLAINKNRTISALGAILTPILLLSIAVIVFFSYSHGTPRESSEIHHWHALKNGFFQGYQTMDLLAAFFFSQFIIKHLYESLAGSTNKSILMIFFKSSIVGAAILSAIYFALVMLGWLHFPILDNKPPQEMLGIIAMESLGPIAAPFVCLAVMFACITTAIVLAYLFAELLRHEITRDKISHSQALIITLVIGFLVSNLEFAGIAQFLGPILEVTYPALIALTLFNIGYKYWKSYSLVPLTKVSEEQNQTQ